MHPVAETKPLTIPVAQCIFFGHSSKCLRKVFILTVLYSFIRDTQRFRKLARFQLLLNVALHFGFFWATFLNDAEEQDVVSDVFRILLF